MDANDYKKVYNLYKNTYKIGRVLTDIYPKSPKKKDVIELIIDNQKEIEHTFKDADKIYANTINNGYFYYETLCIIDGEIRCPVYNVEVYNENTARKVTVEDFIESLKQICGEFVEIHEQSKKNLPQSDNNIEIVKSYVNNCINIMNKKINDKYVDNVKNKISKLNIKNNLDNYADMYEELSNEFLNRDYEAVLDIYKHNAENPKLLKKYPSLKDDYEELCEYVFYSPIINGADYNSFMSLRSGSSKKINSEFDKLTKELSGNIFGDIRNKYDKLNIILKDK